MSSYTSELKFKKRTYKRFGLICIKPTKTTISCKNPQYHLLFYQSIMALVGTSLYSMTVDLKRKIITTIGIYEDENEDNHIICPFMCTKEYDEIELCKIIGLQKYTLMDMGFDFDLYVKFINTKEEWKMWRHWWEARREMKELVEMEFGP